MLLKMLLISWIAINIRIENFISELEEKSNKLEEKLKQLEIENSRLSGLSNLYQKQY